MLIEQAEVFSQLMWTVLLSIPTVMALLHVPLLAQWMWERACGRRAPVA